MGAQSSLLQGLIGEMRKIKGHVSFGGRVAYCSQTAWIQNATLVRCLFDPFMHALHCIKLSLANSARMFSLGNRTRKTR